MVIRAMFMHCAGDRAFSLEALEFCPLISLRRNTIAPTLNSELLTLVHVNLLMPPKP